MTRSLDDVTAASLSADPRFSVAYDAARALSLIIVRTAGYRPRALGAHYNTFAALEKAEAVSAQPSAYFDGCRTKRHTSDYDCAGRITETDAAGPFATVQQFATDPEAG